MDTNRLKAKIADMAARPKNVPFDELETLLDNHIGPLFKNYNHHGNPHHAFTVGEHTFNVPKPHGGGFVKKRYIEFFLEAMEAVDLSDPDRPPKRAECSKTKRGIQDRKTRTGEPNEERKLLSFAELSQNSVSG